MISFNSFKEAPVVDNNINSHCLTINVVSNNNEEGEKKQKSVEEDEQEEEEMKVPDTPIRALKRRISSLSNIFRVKPTYKKVEHEEEKEDRQKAEKIEKEKKKQIHSKHSRLDTSSLSAVTRKLHLSYLIAIGCIVIAFLVSFLVCSFYVFCIL